MSLKRLLRVLVAVALTAYVLWTANPVEVLEASARADLRWMTLAMALVLMDRALMALRWMDLLVALSPGTRPPLRAVLRIFFMSSFVSNFVPSVAADMYRAFALSRHDVRLAESTASVLMDRVLGVSSMVIVGAAALPLATHAGGNRTVVGWLAAALAACAVATAIVFSERAARAVLGIAGVFPWRAARQAAVSLTDAIRRYGRHHRQLSRVLVMSVTVQAIRIIQAWCLGRALGIELPLAAYFALVPVILLIMQVPVTINGLGTTQLAFDRLFVPAGVLAAEAFALSVLFLALGVVGSLPGGLLYALNRTDAVPDRSGA